MTSWTKRRIEKSLGGYRQVINQENADARENVQPGSKVAVVGGGLAGLAAACSLAERGVKVDVFESAGHLGGKCGAWPHTLRNGDTVWVEHGFHAVFRQYYNCRELFDRTGVSQSYKSIEDYHIVGLDWNTATFADIETTPVLNLLSLWKKGLYKMGEILFSRAIRYMPEFLKYDSVKTFEKFDDMSYDTFCEEGRIPEDLRFVFNTFARAFFAEGDRMSMAEVIKSFHFYFLSHDEGLLYEYLDNGYHHSLITPLRSYLEQRGVQFHLNTPIESLVPGETEETVEVNGSVYSYCVLASDVTGVRSIVDGSERLLEEHPGVREELAHVQASQRYCVIRIWANVRVGEELPVFIITEKAPMLDSVTFCHRAEKDCENWAGESRAIYELHCYAVPDTISDEAEAEETLLREFFHYFPEVKREDIVDTYIQLNRNFSAFHVGQYSNRPTTTSSYPRIKYAGDWVKLPCPAMLMEAAVTSGVLAANEILEAENTRNHPVYSVPLRGILA